MLDSASLLRSGVLSFCVLAVCAAAPVFCDDDPMTALAKSLNDADAKKVERLLAHDIRSQDPRMRAAAARAINVRRMTALLDHVRTQMDVERDGAAAREEIRTVVMLGGVRDLARALWVSDRFDRALDDTAAIAAAHFGQGGIDAFFTTLRTRNIDVGNFFTAALWGRSEIAPSVAMRLLAADKEAFQRFLFAIDNEPDELLTTDVFLAALADADTATRAEMLWYLANRSVFPGAPPFDSRVKTAVAAMKDDKENPDYTVGLELLRRILKVQGIENAEFRLALGESPLSQLRIFFAPKKLLGYVGASNQPLVLHGASVPEHRVDANVRPLPFVAPSLLPNGMASAVMRANGCTSGWVGEAMVRVDKAGRVAGSSLDFVAADAACKRALQTLLDLSIVDNLYVAAPFETSRMSMTQTASAEPCLDQGVVKRTGKRIFGSYAIRLPKAVRIVDPDIPKSPERKAKESLVELVITRHGCVRSARLLRTIDKATDDAVLRAVEQWQFQPAHFDTDEVETTMILRVPLK